MLSKQWIQRGFLIAGAVNVLGMPLFSKFFTNDYLTQLDPATFSRVSLVMIVLWGFAYLAVSRHYDKVPAVSAVFAVEKFFYTGVWVCWIWNHFGDLSAIYEKDLITGFFYTVYGANDFLFGVFFLYVFFHLRSAKSGE